MNLPNVPKVPMWPKSECAQCPDECGQCAQCPQSPNVAEICVQLCTVNILFHLFNSLTIIALSVTPSPGQGSVVPSPDLG